LRGVETDEKRIVTSTGALSLPEVPKRLLVVGAGVIGLELGSVWRRLGGEVGKQAQRILQKQGMTFRLSQKVAAIDTSGPALKVGVEPAAGGTAEVIETDMVLVSIGRRPYTAGLGLAEAGVALDERG